MKDYRLFCASGAEVKTKVIQQIDEFERIVFKDKKFYRQHLFMNMKDSFCHWREVSFFEGSEEVKQRLEKTFNGWIWTMKNASITATDLIEMHEKFKAKFKDIPNGVVCSFAMEVELRERIALANPMGYIDFRGIQVFPCKWLETKEIYTTKGSQTACDLVGFINFCESIKLNWRSLLTAFGDYE